ncbi:MAG: 30S ribosomal protein S3 [Deltaproteobacteria bacterium]|nr:30S ribosomal protein S3 [Deltaproteobacteria bacterium]
MGQKVNPLGFRIGVTRTWGSKWYAEKAYEKWLRQDLAIKRSIKEKMVHAGISKVDIERSSNKCTVNVHTARPGIIIGKKGQGAELLKADIQKLTESKVYLNIHEVRKAETDAQLVAENVATQLERRVSFRRAMKKSVQTAMKFGAKGIRLNASGRLGGAEMSRREWYREGRVPLHTLRADIDYGFALARTTYGIIGIQCWVYKGDVLKERRGKQSQPRAGR